MIEITNPKGYRFDYYVWIGLRREPCVCWLLAANFTFTQPSGITWSEHSVQSHFSINPFWICFVTHNELHMCFFNTRFFKLWLGGARLRYDSYAGRTSTTATGAHKSHVCEVCVSHALHAQQFPRCRWWLGREWFISACAQANTCYLWELSQRAHFL